MQYALNLKWQVTAWDKTLELVSGFARHEVLGRNFVEDLVVYEDQRAVLDVFGYIRHSKKEVHNFAFVLYSKSGYPIKLFLDVFPYFDETKSVDGISIIAKGSSQQEAIAFGNMHFAFNSRWQVTAWNEQLQSVTHFERDEIVGRHFPDFVVQEDQEDLQHVIDQAYQLQEDMHDIGFTLYSKNGMPNRMRLNMSLYFNEDRSATGVSISAKRASEDCVENKAYFDSTVEAAIQLLEDDALSSKKKRAKTGHSSATTTATSLDELPVSSLGSLPGLSGSPSLEELPLGCDVS